PSTRVVTAAIRRFLSRSSTDSCSKGLGNSCIDWRVSVRNDIAHGVFSFDYKHFAAKTGALPENNRKSYDSSAYCLIYDRCEGSQDSRRVDGGCSEVCRRHLERFGDPAGDCARTDSEDEGEWGYQEICCDTRLLAPRKARDRVHSCLFHAGYCLPEGAWRADKPLTESG